MCMVCASTLRSLPFALEIEHVNLNPFPETQKNF